MREVLLEFVSLLAESLLNWLLPVVASMAAAWLFAKAKEAWAKLKAAKPEEIELLEKIARMAVLAAEQSGLSGAIQDKKAYALDLVENALLERGIKVNIHEIEAAIEAAVMNEFNRGKVE